MAGELELIGINSIVAGAHAYDYAAKGYILVYSAGGTYTYYVFHAEEVEQLV